MISRLDCSDATPTTYWSIINRFFNKKNIPNILLLLLNGKLGSDFHKKS